MDTLAFGYILPTTGRIPDFHRLETCAAGRTKKKTKELLLLFGLFYSLTDDSAIYSFGPAATSAFPASLPVYLPKFLINLPARSFAFSSHSEAF